MSLSYALPSAGSKLLGAFFNHPNLKTQSWLCQLQGLQGIHAHKTKGRKGHLMKGRAHTPSPNKTITKPGTFCAHSWCFIVFCFSLFYFSFQPSHPDLFSHQSLLVLISYVSLLNPFYFTAVTLIKPISLRLPRHSHKWNFAFTNFFLLMKRKSKNVSIQDQSKNVSSN